jgi:hypothetical protein
MRRVIVEYAKLTNEILNLLVDKFPDGYDDRIWFSVSKNELIEGRSTYWRYNAPVK